MLFLCNFLSKSLIAAFVFLMTWVSSIRLWTMLARLELCRSVISIHVKESKSDNRLPSKVLFLLMAAAIEFYHITSLAGFHRSALLTKEDVLHMPPSWCRRDIGSKWQVAGESPLNATCYSILQCDEKATGSELSLDSFQTCPEVFYYTDATSNLAFCTMINQVDPVDVLLGNEMCSKTSPGYS